MIRISQLKLPAGHSKTELYHKAAKALHIKSEQIASLQIRRQSIDARKKAGHFLDLRRGHHIKRHLRAKLCVPQQK